MATYAVGDIQGCCTELEYLLHVIHFDPAQDVLWCTGDVVNRGPKSLEALRLLKSLGDRAVVVLGNHDLHLLKLAYEEGVHSVKPSDQTLMPILLADDCQELLEWLRHRPLLHHDAELGYTMLHAGLPPQWTHEEARRYAREAEAVLQGEQYRQLLENLYGNRPARWSEDLEGMDRLRFIINCLTRLRYCDRDGKLLMKSKGTPVSMEMRSCDKEHPWFVLPNRASRDHRILFGHWSTLGYYHGHNVYALDTGCLWGGMLTALRLEDQAVFNIPCPGAQSPGRC